ncbi:hypothetical protein, unlikely [Trypanosoma congolense IL3000]|uniref:Uncharacterized protein n=1 Tax=Trypanosoma congolense (strain IL3000) TaxID=1068625 RepID=F9WGS9_TRYCI|nr:hypothetical protein, unlikely [Trypanosoma congolense IL3000]
MCRPLSPFLDNLFTEFVQVGADERSLQESFITVVRSLLHFEGHWLGLPQSEVLLIRVTEDGGAGTAVSNASSSLDTPPRRWSTWLGGGEGSKSDVSPVGWRTIDICTSGCSDSVSLNSEVINSVQHLFTRAWE